jgi:hypothetical protein
LAALIDRDCRGYEIDIAAMLRKQDKAIRQLREALKGAISDVGHEMSDAYMESVMHSTDYHAAKAALAATEEF